MRGNLAQVKFCRTIHTRKKKFFKKVKTKMCIKVKFQQRDGGVGVGGKHSLKKHHKSGDYPL